MEAVSVLKEEAIDIIAHVDSRDIKLAVNLENGYFVSVIRNEMSYGYEHGLFEIALLEELASRHIGMFSDFHLVYSTEVTDGEDVLGYLTANEVIEKINLAASRNDWV